MYKKLKFTKLGLTGIDYYHAQALPCIALVDGKKMLMCQTGDLFSPKSVIKAMFPPKPNPTHIKRLTMTASAILNSH